jgi:hypothetical protein
MRGVLEQISDDGWFFPIASPAGEYIAGSTDKGTSALVTAAGRIARLVAKLRAAQVLDTIRRITITARDSSAMHAAVVKMSVRADSAYERATKEFVLSSLSAVIADQERQHHELSRAGYVAAGWVLSDIQRQLKLISQAAASATPIDSPEQEESAELQLWQAVSAVPEQPSLRRSVGLSVMQGALSLATRWFREPRVELPDMRLALFGSYAVADSTWEQAGGYHGYLYQSQVRPSGATQLPAQCQAAAHSAFEAAFAGDVATLEKLLAAPRAFPLAYVVDTFGRTLLHWSAAPLPMPWPSSGNLVDGSSSGPPLATGEIENREVSRPSARAVALLLAAASRSYVPRGPKRRDSAWGKPAGRIDNVLLMGAVVGDSGDADSDIDSDSDLDSEAAIELQLGRNAPAGQERAARKAADAQQQALDARPGTTRWPPGELLARTTVVSANWVAATQGKNGKVDSDPDEPAKLVSAIEMAVLSGETEVLRSLLAAAHLRERGGTKEAEMTSDALEVARRAVPVALVADSVAALELLLVQEGCFGGLHWREAARAQGVDVKVAFRCVSDAKQALRDRDDHATSGTGSAAAASKARPG